MLIIIDLQDCELVYEFPEQVEDFSNFDIWPIFCCLRVWQVSALSCLCKGTDALQIADIFEVGHTVGGKLILVSEHLAMLTIAAETIRLVCRESGWRGLYSPITHQTHIEATISGVGPYIIGISAVSARSTIFPDDALVVFLDSGVLQRGHGATLYSSSSPTSTRTCFIQRVCGLLGKIRPTGVPEHLREAYHNGKLMLEGQVGFTRAELGIVMPPPWWNETAVRAEVCDVMLLVTLTNYKICAYKRRLLRQSGQKRFPNCLRRTPLVQVSAWRLAESSLRQSQNLRDAHDAWQKYLTLSSKIKYDGCQAEHERSKLLEELRSWKLQFERQKSLCVEQSLQLDKTKSHVHDQEMAHADLIRSKLATESLLQKSIAAMKSTELERDNLKAANDALSSGKLSAEIAGQEGKSQLQTLIGRREAIKSEMRALKDLLETYSVVKTTCDEARAQNLVGKLHPGSTQHAAKALHLSKPTGDEMVHLHGSFPLLSV